MANNFRIVGDLYLSKAGNDSNSGLTADLPKKTFSGLMTALSGLSGGDYDLIVGTGLYDPSGSHTTTSGQKLSRYFADSLAIFRGNGSNSLTLSATGTGNQEFYNFLFENYSSLTIGSNLNSIKLENCIIKNNCTLDKRFGSAEKANINNSKFINSAITFFPSSTFTKIFFDSNIFINSTTNSAITSFAASGDSSFKNNYIDVNSIFTYNGHPDDFRNNNVQGIILLDGNQYAIQDQLTGTPQDNGYASGVEWLTEAQLTTDGYSGTISGWDTAVATCFNRNPQFNNVSKLDFSISANSPHFQNAEGAINNIGGTKVGQGFYGTDDEWNVSMEASQDANITGTSDRTLSSGTSGTITSAPIQTPGGILLSPIVVNYVGSLLFNSDLSGGSSDNKNVPDSLNYSSGDAGRNPNRLSYEMRWTTSTTKPTQDSDWTNGGYITAGNWANFEWGKEPRIDSNERGNGDENYDQNNNQPIEFIWYQVRVTLRNNYAS